MKVVKHFSPPIFESNANLCAFSLGLFRPRLRSKIILLILSILSIIPSPLSKLIHPVTKFHHNSGCD